MLRNFSKPKNEAPPTEILSSFTSPVVPFPVNDLQSLQTQVVYDYHGIFFVLEWLTGEERSKKGRNGRKWTVKLPAAYGYITDTCDREGEELDVYVAGPDMFVDSQRIFVIDQITPETGAFDEHKIMVGFPTIDAAKDAYCAAFSDGSGLRRMGEIKETTVAEVKSWLSINNDSPFSSAQVLSLEAFADSEQTPAETPSTDTPERPSDPFGEVNLVLPPVGPAPVLLMQPIEGEEGATHFDVFLYSPFEDQKWGGAADDIVRRLASAKTNDVFTFHIASPGGEIDVAARIASAIRTTNARVITVAEGLVASAGCLIWCEGHERQVRRASCIMQHFSSHGALGHTGDIERQARALGLYITRVILTRAVDIGLLTEEEAEGFTKRDQAIYLSAEQVIARTGAELV